MKLELHGVTLNELAFLRHFNVRIQPDDGQVHQRFQRMLGFGLPLNANTFVLHDETLCAWLGPDEWLIVAPVHRTEFLEQTLRDVTADSFAACVNISAAQTMIRVAGPQALDLLGRGVAYDLHPGNFTAGSCVQTILARTAVTMLCQSANEPTIDVIVRRSFADYLWHWLLDAGQESEFHPV